jgi:hypothetical protein
MRRVTVRRQNAGIGPSGGLDGGMIDSFPHHAAHPTAVARSADRRGAKNYRAPARRAPGEALKYRSVTTEPQRFTVLLVPEYIVNKDAVSAEESAVRSAAVKATGETGETGYPRYAGDGIVADIDPRSRTVEAVLVDGSELDYGLNAIVST